MYVLRFNEYISVQIRIDSIELGTDDFGRPRLNGIATLRLSPDAEDVKVALWVNDKYKEVVIPDEDFVARDAVLEGFCHNDHDSPYAREDVGIKGIWFSRDRTDIDKNIVLLIRDMPFGI